MTAGSRVLPGSGDTRRGASPGIRRERRGLVEQGHGDPAEMFQPRGAAGIRIIVRRIVARISRDGFERGEKVNLGCLPQPFPHCVEQGRVELHRGASAEQGVADSRAQQARHLIG